jgi:hypothetical protein
MDFGPRIERLLIALALLSAVGCTIRPAGSTNTATSEPNLTIAPIPSLSASAPASAPLPLDAPTNTAQKSASQTSKSTPEWTRAAEMTTPQDYATTIEKARQHLAARLRLDPAAVQFIQLNLDEFPADTLGCLGPNVTPRPIPAIVSGQVIILEANGLHYTYHARKEQVVFCGPWQ